MKPLRTILTAAACAALPVIAVADCADLQDVSMTPELQGAVEAIQRGLQTALGDTNPLLDDGRLGEYTQTKLVELCNEFPLPSDINLVDGTLSLAAEYGALAQDLGDWKRATSTAAFAASILPGDDSLFNFNILPLMAPAAVTGRYLRAQTGANDCGTLTNQTLSEGAHSGQLVLNGLDPDTWPDAATTCSIMDLAEGAASTIAMLESVAHLEKELPGSVNQVLAPDFVLWLSEGITTRGPRLVGSDLAVVSLVAEYRAENRTDAPPDYSAIYQNLPASCAQPSGDAITDYVSFDESTLAGLIAPVDVASLLGDLTAQTFDSSDALAQAITSTLGDQVTDCTRDQILQAVQSPENFGKAYTLDADKTANLTLIGDFAQAAPVVAPFVGLSANSRGALLAGVRAAIQTATQDQVFAEVEAAADVLASAAEPMPDTFDTLPAGVPPFEPLPLNPTIGVTEATDSAIAATVTDPAFREALLGANYPPAPNPEVLKSDARKVLSPIADDKIAAIVNRAMIELRPAVETSWGLTPTLSAAIAAAPAAQGIPDAAQTDETANALNALLGVEYPNSRLLDAALAPIQPDTLANEIRTKALRSGADPNAVYDTAIALPGCGCVNPREENSEIYGFYPFWMAPKVQQTTTGSDDEDVPAAGRLVDFSIVSRAAFYGLELTINGSGSPAVQNEAQWTNGQRDFVNAAHRHRAKADLAIKLTGWDQWSDLEISTVVRKIETLTEPFPRSDSSDFTALWAAFPTALDRPQVDGVTLIIEGYDGTPGQELNIKPLLSLVTRLKEALRERNQTINLALDLAIGGSEPTDLIFQDIEELLKGENPKVDYVLLFLERPTTGTKKTLRQRMDQNVFRGDDRALVLRRIIPVIPPAGHEFVLQSPALNQNSSTNSSGSYSQFKDDLVYFQDNFAGVGFWPTPDPTGPETDKINLIFQKQWFVDAMPEFLVSFEDEIDSACTFICPNRTYFAAAIALIFTITTLLVLRSFYSGFVNKLAFKLGLAWLGGGVMFAGLLVLTLCDNVAIWPPLFLFLMIVGAIFLVLFNIYQRAKNGPKP